jgi:hypothetical protein
MKKPKHPRPPKLTDAERHKRFVETAIRVGASDKSEDFDAAFDSLAVRRSFVKEIDITKPRE